MHRVSSAIFSADRTKKPQQMAGAFFRAEEGQLEGIDGHDGRIDGENVLANTFCEGRMEVFHGLDAYPFAASRSMDIRTVLDVDPDMIDARA